MGVKRLRALRGPDDREITLSHQHQSKCAHSVSGRLLGMQAIP